MCKLVYSEIFGVGHIDCRREWPFISSTLVKVEPLKMSAGLIYHIPFRYGKSSEDKREEENY